MLPPMQHSWATSPSCVPPFRCLLLRAVGTQSAYTDTNNVLHQLQITVDGTLNTVHSAGIAAVVVTMLMALLMVFMALGRTSLERKIDEQGECLMCTHAQPLAKTMA